MDFEEKAVFGIVAKITTVIGIAAALFGLLVAYYVSGEMPAWVNAFIILIMAFVVAVLALFYSMRFGSDAKTVYARAFFMRYSIKKKDLARVKIMPSIPFWAGWGLRFWWDGAWVMGFVSQHAPALVFEKKTGFCRRIVFSVKDPKAFARKAGLKLSA